jgi:hypothetical protein
MFLALMVRRELEEVTYLTTKASTLQLQKPQKKIHVEAWMDKYAQP